MNENDDLIRRLGDLGRRPVDPDVAARHLTQMTAPRPGPGFAHRLRVVGAFAVGLLVGTTGLATAGALPDPVQEVAHHTLGAVGVDVPRADRYNGAECEGGPYKNHGEYVRSQPKEKRADAAASRCGKPVQAGEGADDGEGPKARPGGAGDCQGPPPWAGSGKPADKAARKAAQDERRARCGEENGDKAEDAEHDKAVAPAGGEAGVPAEPGTGDDSADESGDGAAEPTTTTTTAPSDGTTTTTTTTGDDPGATTTSTATTSTTGLVELPDAGTGS